MPSHGGVNAAAIRWHAIAPQRVEIAAHRRERCAGRTCRDRARCLAQYRFGLAETASDWLAVGHGNNQSRAVQLTPVNKEALLVRPRQSRNYAQQANKSAARGGVVRSPS